MRPLSDSTHKAMLPVGRTTILARIVTSLREIGVDVINVVTGYRADEVEDYLTTSCSGPTYRFVRNPHYETTNNIVSLRLALDALEDDEDILLTECDLLLSPGMFERLAGSGRGNSALVGRYRAGMDGTVVTLRDGLVSRVVPPDAQGPAFEYRDTYKTLNVYRFSHPFCRDVLAPGLREHVDAGDSSIYYEVVLARLGDLTEHGIAGEIVEDDTWAEVDDPHDLAAARFQFEPERRAAVLDRTLGGHWNFAVTDFAFMRNAYFPTDAMLASMRHALAELVDSYGSTQHVLNEKLAWFLECAPEHVEALNGAAQAFPLLRRLWADRTIAVPAPTFGEYAAAFPDALTYADAPGIDPLELERMAAQVDVLVLVNPNNPTGTTLPTADLWSLAARHPATHFLVDESFIEFSEEPSMLRALEADGLQNVTVLCSLSKTLGVPGLRIGYLYSRDRSFLDAVDRDIPVWNMGAVAEYFVELLLKFRPQLAASLEQTRVDREQFASSLASVPMVADVAPSGGNFLLVRLHGPTDAAHRLRERLLISEAIDLKDVTAKFDDGRPRIRLAVRKPAENRRLTSVLRRLGSPESLVMS